jgi:hypothetical protein
MLIPAGAIVAIADLDDPEPAELLRRGFDVVLYLYGRGAMDDGSILLRAVWRPGLVPGRRPPAPFRVRLTPAGFVRVGMRAERRYREEPPAA